MVLWRRAAAAQGKPPHAHQPQWWRIRGLKQRISTTTSGASTPLTTTSCPNTRGGGPSSHRADPPSSWVRRKLRRRRRGHGSTKKIPDQDEVASRDQRRAEGTDLAAGSGPEGANNGERWDRVFQLRRAQQCINTIDQNNAARDTKRRGNDNMKELIRIPSSTLPNTSGSSNFNKKDLYFYHSHHLSFI